MGIMAMIDAAVIAPQSSAAYPRKLVTPSVTV